eukprot:2290927-Rhodomonas_salina.1
MGGTRVGVGWRRVSVACIQGIAPGDATDLGVCQQARVVDVSTLGLHCSTYLLERADSLRCDYPYPVVVLQHADLLGPAPPVCVSDGLAGDGLESMVGARVACLPSTSLQPRPSTNSSANG